jgi:hypothetical protein
MDLHPVVSRTKANNVNPMVPAFVIYANQDFKDLNKTVALLKVAPNGPFA